MSGERTYLGMRAVQVGMSLLLFFGVLLASGSNEAGAQDIKSEKVSIPLAGSGGSAARTIRGTLNIPAGPKPMPAIVILHSKAGIDGTGAFYAKALNSAGIASLEIEMFAQDQLPVGGINTTLPHALGALKFLAARADIDKARIGAMGFSWGGNLSLRLATARQYSRGADGARPLIFSALIGIYPGCYLMVQEAGYAAVPFVPMAKMTPAPILVLAAEKDDYERPDSCPRFKASLPAEYQGQVEVYVFPGATHGFDDGRARRVYDGAANLGRGATVTYTPNAAVAEQSRQMSVDFLRRVFAMGS